MQSIVCDTDAGSDADDYLALAYLANAGSLKLVFTTYGPVQTRARAVGTLFKAMNADIPVVAGVRQLLTPLKPIWLTGDESYLVDQTIVVGDDLDAYLHLDKFTLLAIGPLTNVAHLVQQPEFVARCQRIVIMGGTTHRQILDREHNFHADPIATNIVMDALIPKTIVPLELTAPLPMTDAHYTRFRDSTTEYGQLLWSWVSKWRNHTAWQVTYADWVEMVDHCMPFAGNVHWHDPIAAAFITHPELFTTETVHARADHEGGLIVGRGQPVQVCTAMQQQVIELIVSTILEGTHSEDLDQPA
jgi:pyrimidine-specific ribonucleoside hydrolase